MKKVLFFLVTLCVVLPSLASTNGFCNISYYFNSDPIKLSNDRFTFSFKRDGACWVDSVKLKLDLSNPGCSVKKVYVLLKDGYHETEKVNSFYYLGKFGLGGTTTVTVEFEYEDTVSVSNIGFEVKNVGASNVYGSVCEKKISFVPQISTVGSLSHQFGQTPKEFSNWDNISLNWDCSTTSNVSGLQYLVLFNTLENFQIDSIRFYYYSNSIRNGNEFNLGTIYCNTSDINLKLFGKGLTSQEDFVLPFVTTIKDPLANFEVVAEIKDTLRFRYVAPLTTSIQDSQTETSIQLFPNPVKANSELTLIATKSSEYQLIDVQGRLLQSGKLTNGTNKILMPKSGLYQLRLEESEVHKIVVE